MRAGFTLQVSKNVLPSYVTTLILSIGLSFLISCSSRQPKGVNLILPKEDQLAESMVWSPVDSNRILVSTCYFMGRCARTYILNIKTGEKQVLADLEQGDIRGDTWSPDGEKVVLSNRMDTEENLPGFKILSLVDQTSENIFLNGEASWSPTGDSLAVIKRPAIIHLIDINSLNDQMIFSGGESDHLPSGLSWSPDSKKIVFSFGDDYKSNLYILDIDTHKVTQITNDGSSFRPVWSRRGDLILYTRHTYRETEKMEVPSLNLIKVDGNCNIEVPYTEYAISPTWSPDGNLIGFIRSGAIYSINLNEVFGRDIYQSICQ